MSSQWRPRPNRSHLVVGLLLLILVLSGVLAFQAHRAARAQQATAREALVGYAAMATNGLWVNGQEWVFQVLRNTMGAQAFGTYGPVPVAPGKELGGCACLLSGEPLARFEWSPAGLHLEAPGALAPAVAAYIADSLPAHPTARFGKVGFGLAFPRGSGLGLAFQVEQGAKGRPVRIAGLVARTHQFEPVFRAVVERAALLPAALLGPGGNEGSLSLSVTTPDGTAVFTSAHTDASEYRSAQVLPLAFGGLLVRAAVRPDAIGRLVGGAVTRFPVPLPLAVLALSAVLVIIALLQLRKEAELARLREGFVSGVSHELRTPLAQIRMFTETLLLGRVRSEAESRRSLEIIDQEARRLTQLVENVLRFARTNRGVSRVAPETANLAGEMLAAVEAFRPLAGARRAELRAEVQPGIIAAVDRDALRQILVNLLDNAVKYGPSGQRVTVGLALYGESARLWVDDEGPGIPPADRERIFAPFYRAAREAGSAVGGSGIGLAVVRELVVLHGGRVWAQAAPGGGARMTVELPGAYIERPAVAAADWAAA